MSEIQQISVEDLKQMLDDANDFVLLDVREQSEWDICRVEGAKLKPLSAFASWIEELDAQAHYVFMCHHGNRSMQAASVAQSYGLGRVSNLVGGIDAWSARIDGAVARY